MPSWLPKVPSWLRKNDLCLSQSALSNFSLYVINNGNRTERSPIRSAIIQVINKIGRPRSGSPICWSWVWLQTELDDTMSCYQLIITITISEKQKGLIGKKTFNRNISKFTSGKISPAETLSKVTNSAVLEKPQPWWVSFCCYSDCNQCGDWWI